MDAGTLYKEQKNLGCFTHTRNNSNIHRTDGHVTLTILTLLAFCLLISLGFWQLQRAQQKRALLQTFTTHHQQAPLTMTQLDSTTDLRYYQIKLEGRFDNQHTFLLDNRIHEGRVGYEIYTPFKIKGLDIVLLINRGWIPFSGPRSQLPAIPSIAQPLSITGTLNPPPGHFSLGNLTDSSTNHWPLRIEYIDLQMLSKLVGYPLFPYILWLDSHNQGSFTPIWAMTTINPEKHIAYAIQWFALALGLLIVFTALMKKRH